MLTKTSILSQIPKSIVCIKTSNLFLPVQQKHRTALLILLEAISCPILLQILNTISTDIPAAQITAALTAGFFADNLATVEDKPAKAVILITGSFFSILFSNLIALCS